MARATPGKTKKGKTRDGYSKGELSKEALPREIDNFLGLPNNPRARFLRNWDGRSLATLCQYTRATMPEDNPGSLTAEEYVDVIAEGMATDAGVDPEDDLYGRLLGVMLVEGNSTIATRWLQRGRDRARCRARRVLPWWWPLSATRRSGWHRRRG